MIGTGAGPINWTAIPAEAVSNGVTRQVFSGERVMVCRLQLAPHVVTTIHSHPHEQITIVERGRARFSVDGEERMASAGDVLHIPPGARHGTTILDEPVVLIDIFSPIREEFLPPAG